MNYKLGHFSNRESFDFDYIRARLTYDKKYLVNNFTSYMPKTGIKKEIITCAVCKRKIKIRIASRSKSKIINRIYKTLSLLILCLTTYLIIKSSFEEWLAIISIGGLISLFIFLQDYSKPKVMKDIKLNFVGHKIL